MMADDTRLTALIEDNMTIGNIIAKIESTGWAVDQLGGNCPVQVSARLDDQKFLYFRARGNFWDICVASNEDDAVDAIYKNPAKERVLLYKRKAYPNAGYMPLEKVTDIVLEAIKEVGDVG